MEKFLKYVIIFIILIVIYLASLMLTSLIPRELIEKQVKESAETLVEEGNHHIIDFKIKTILLDNYTTALMINNAYSMDSNAPLASSLLVRKNFLPGITQMIYETSSGSLVGASQYEEFDGVHELQGTVNKEITESYEYARYWHGYLIILKPLLILFNVSQIRILSTILLVLLSIYLLYQIYKKIDKKTVILFLLGLLFCEILILGLELQGQLNIYIMLITSIIILKKYREDKKYNYCLLFFIIGSITNFMDFFTTPILTYTFPLVVYFILDSINHEKNIKEILQLMIKSGIAWSIGYVFTWIAKWVIVDGIYHRNIIQNAIAQIQYRGLDTSCGYLETIWRNLKEWGAIELSILIYLIFYNVIITIYYIIKKEKNTNIIFYTIMSLIPFIWYFIVRQHSHQHPAYTYRILYTTVIANILIFSENLSIVRKQKISEKQKINKKK